MEIHWLKVVGTLALQQALELSMYYKSWPLLRPLNHCTNLKQWDLQDKNTHTHTRAHMPCLLDLLDSKQQPCSPAGRPSPVIMNKCGVSLCTGDLCVYVCQSDDDLCVIGSWSCSHWMELKKQFSGKRWLCL